MPTLLFSSQKLIPKRALLNRGMIEKNNYAQKANSLQRSNHNSIPEISNGIKSYREARAS